MFAVLPIVFFLSSTNLLVDSLHSVFIVVVTFLKILFAYFSSQQNNLSIFLSRYSLIFYYLDIFSLSMIPLPIILTFASFPFVSFSFSLGLIFFCIFNYINFTDLSAPILENHHCSCFLFSSLYRCAG